MQHDRGDPDRWACSAGRRGLGGVARLVRVLTAAVLLGSALLIVALVGQGVATARPNPSDQHPTVHEPSLAQPARNGAGDHDPTLAYLADLLNSAKALDPLAGPVLPTGVPAAGDAGAGAGSRPTGPDRLPSGQEGSETTPHLERALQRKPVRLAQASVADDAGDADPGRQDRALAAATPVGEALTVAQATSTPTPPRSVGEVLNPVVKSANTLALQAFEVAPVIRPVLTYRGSEPVFDSAGLARQLEGEGKTAEAHAQMDAAISAFGGLIERAARTGVHVADRAKELEQAIDHAWKGALRVHEERRRSPTIEGVQKPPSKNPASFLVGVVRANSEGLMEHMQTSVPDEQIDDRMRSLAQAIRDHEQSARQLEDGSWIPYRSRAPEAAHGKAREAIETLRGLVELADVKALLMREKGRALALAAQEAAGVAETAKAQAERLKSGGTKSPQPQQDGRLLDDPETSPEGNIRHAATGDAQPPSPAGADSAAVAPTPPSGVVDEPGWTPADATVVQTPAEQPATLDQQAEARPESSSITTPTPVEVADTGWTPGDGGSLPADTAATTGVDGATGTLVSDNADTRTDDGSAPGTYADAGVSDLDNGVFSGSLVG